MSASIRDLRTPTGREREAAVFGIAWRYDAHQR
jgi:hypothetical protein